MPTWIELDRAECQAIDVRSVAVLSKRVARESMWRSAVAHPRARKRRTTCSQWMKVAWGEAEWLHKLIRYKILTNQHRITSCQLPMRAMLGCLSQTSAMRVVVAIHWSIVNAMMVFSVTGVVECAPCQE